MNDDGRRGNRPLEHSADPARKQEPLALLPFLALAREIGALLVSVQMRPEYRAELYESLLIAARRQSAQNVLDITPPIAEPSSLDRKWVIGAAVGSAVSLAGIVAYIWRQRNQRAA